MRPHVPVVIFEMFVNIFVQHVKHIEQFRVGKQHTTLHQVLKVRIHPRTDTGVEGSPVSGLHVDVVAKQTNVRASLPQRVECIGSRFYEPEGKYARLPSQVFQVNNTRLPSQVFQGSGIGKMGQLLDPG